ncbi:MAG: cytochrome c peroxidase [Chitinophagaceae bacterium]
MLKKQKLIFFLLLFIGCCSFLLSPFSNNNQSIRDYYIEVLENSRQKLMLLKNSCEKKKKITVLQEDFRTARLAYKELAVLSEYFFQIESRLLNGPPLDRVEEDYPTKIIKPQGFQVVEDLLFNSWQNNSYQSVLVDIKQMLITLSQLEHKDNLEKIFNDRMIWNAMQSSIIRIMTLGITGYDSPAAMNSIPEANASLKSLEQLSSIIKTNTSKINDADYDNLVSLFHKAESYLNANNDFNNFNRLEFITDYLNPLYKRIVELRKSADIAMPEGNYVLNFNAPSIFSDTSFNINFYSPGNDYLLTKERIELGKKLFYDPILSETKNRSCASCHKPELAFSDGLKTAMAIDQKTSLLRNTPTLLNSGLQSHLFYDSRADILENQLDEVVHNAAEMKGSFAKTIPLLKNDEVYHRLFTVAYPTQKETISPFNIANAIASYVRSLNTLNSRFDQYIRGDSNALSETEQKGFNLFMGKAKCATCHHPPLFNGLLPPEFTETESEVLGVPSTADTIHAKIDTDPGKFLFTQSPVHKFSFKTTTLRNIELTAPYMHNGVYKTLDEVVDFYNKGGGKGLRIAPPNQTLPFDRLNLTKEEENEIISFLKSLTDTTYLNHIN